MPANRYAWVGIVCGIALFAQPPAPEITIVNPAGRFVAPSNPGMTLRAVDAAADSLWFLLRGLGSAEVVQTGSTGRVQTRAILIGANSASIDDFSVSQSGSLAAMRNGQLDIYSPSLSLVRSVNVGGDALGFAFVDQKVFRVTPQAVTSVGDMAGQTFRILEPPLLPNLVLGLGNRRLGIFEMGEAVLHVVDTQTGAWQRYQLAAPEIQGVIREKRTEDQVSPAMSAAAVDHSSGNIYIAATSYNINQGAIVLKFSEDGTLLARLRCTLPKSPDFKTERNKDGHFSFTHLAVVGGKLLLISARQKWCLYYDLI
jgi:hypothetical protein